MLWRIYFQGGRHPSEWNEFRGFGSLSTARFDHHARRRRPEQKRKILYAATTVQICAAEVFQETRTIDRSGRNPWLVGFELRADLDLLDLTGEWPTSAGASMAIGSSESRSLTRHWSRSIYGAYPGVAGLWYASSMYGNQPAVALYEKAQPFLPESPLFHVPLTYEGNVPLANEGLLTLLKYTARRLRYDIV